MYVFNARCQQVECFLLPALYPHCRRTEQEEGGTLPPQEEVKHRPPSCCLLEQVVQAAVRLYLMVVVMVQLQSVCREVVGRSQVTLWERNRKGCYSLCHTWEEQAATQGAHVVLQQGAHYNQAAGQQLGGMIC
jgi:hypothetical protein